MIKRYKETGSIEASYPGRQPKITKEQVANIDKLVTEQPDVTIEEIIDRLKLPVKKSQVSNILRKLGYSFKKEAAARKRTKTTRC